MKEVTENLWTEYDGKKFAARYADFAGKAASACVSDYTDDTKINGWYICKSKTNGDSSITSYLAGMVTFSCNIKAAPGDYGPDRECPPVIGMFEIYQRGEDATVKIYGFDKKAVGGSNLMGQVTGSDKNNTFFIFFGGFLYDYAHCSITVLESINMDTSILMDRLYEHPSPSTSYIQNLEPDIVQFVTKHNTFEYIASKCNQGLLPVLVNQTSAVTYFSQYANYKATEHVFFTIADGVLQVDKVDSEDVWSREEYPLAEIGFLDSFAMSGERFDKCAECLMAGKPLFYKTGNEMYPLRGSYYEASAILHLEWIGELNGVVKYYVLEYTKDTTTTPPTITRTRNDNYNLNSNSSVIGVENTDWFADEIGISSDVVTGTIDSVGKSYTLGVGQTIKVEFSCDFKIANAAYAGESPEHCYQLVLYKKESGETTVYSKCSLYSFYLEGQRSGYTDIKATTASLIYKNTSNSQITLDLGVLSNWGTEGLTGGLGMKNVTLGDIIF